MRKFLEKNTFITWLLILLYLALIFYLSSLPRLSQPGPLKEIGYVDLLEHFVEFSILGFLLVPGFKGLKVRNFFLLAVVFGIFYGVTDEVHQYLVPGRTLELIDLLADSCGVFVGALIAKRS